MALAVPLALPLLTGNKELIDTVYCDGLNFDHAKEIAFTLSLPGGAKQLPATGEQQDPPLALTYRLHWGYRGAGVKTEPFAGIIGSINVQLSYDGLSFQLGKSRSLRSIIKSTITPLITITPCQEFYFKVAQLAWTISQQKYPDLSAIKESLETLIARLKITPGGAECRLRSLPILNQDGLPGLEGYLAQAPDQCAAQFVIISQKLSALVGIITGAALNKEQSAYLQALLENINFYQEEPTLITFPGGGSLYIPFWEKGAGDPYEPFPAITIRFTMPATPNVPQETEWTLPLSAEQTGLLRAVMLVLHNRRAPLGTAKYLEELSALCSRFSITPPSDGGDPSKMRAIVGRACMYHQEIATYSFDEGPLTQVLDNQEFLLQLCRIAYHAFKLKDQAPQVVADFVTLHLADALRCYQGTIMLKEAMAGKASLPILKKHGIEIKWHLFAKTLLAPAPGMEEK